MSCTIVLTVSQFHGYPRARQLYLCHVAEGIHPSALGCEPGLGLSLQGREGARGSCKQQREGGGQRATGEQLRAAWGDAG